MGDIATQSLESQKYLLVVRSENLASGTPSYLKTKFSFHWNSKRSEAEMRAELIKELFQISSEPPLGMPPIILN